MAGEADETPGTGIGRLIRSSEAQIQRGYPSEANLDRDESRNRSDCLQLVLKEGQPQQMPE